MSVPPICLSDPQRLACDLAGIQAAMDVHQQALPAHYAHQLHMAVFATALGDMLAVMSGDVLHMLEFTDNPRLLPEWRAVLQAKQSYCTWHSSAAIQQLQSELNAYFAGTLRTFATPVCCIGTPFQQQAWQALSDIAYASTCTYAQQAAAIGQPRAVRAVAAANAANKIAIVIPCHRVIGSNGRLTGYAGGLWRKQALLALEAGAMQSLLM